MKRLLVIWQVGMACAVATVALAQDPNQIAKEQADRAADAAKAQYDAGLRQFRLALREQEAAVAQKEADLKALRARMDLDAAEKAYRFLSVAQLQNPLGIEIAEAPKEVRAHIKLPDGVGVIVGDVRPETEGAKAGLKSYDIVTSINGTAVADVASFHKLCESAAGQSAKIAIFRTGQPVIIEATMPAVAARFSSLQLVSPAPKTWRIGVVTTSPGEGLSAHLRLGRNQGQLVTEVVADGAAASAGVLVNDVLMAIDEKVITTEDSLRSAIQEVKDRSVPLTLIRQGSKVTLMIQPREQPTGEIVFSSLDRDLTHLDRVAFDLAKLKTDHVLMLNEKLDSRDQSLAIAFDRDLVARVATNETEEATLAGIKAAIGALQGEVAKLEAMIAKRRQTATQAEVEKKQELDKAAAGR